MGERVALTRQEEEDRRVRQEVSNIAQDESVDGEGMVRIEWEQILTIKARIKFAAKVVYPDDNEESTRIQGLIPS
jgi:hypothetical protein